MTDQPINCPYCAGPVQKYGKTPSGDQRYRCMKQGCRRQFVQGADHLVTPEIKALVLGMIDAGIHSRKIYQSVNSASAFLDDNKKNISLRWIQKLRRKVLNDRNNG